MPTRRPAAALALAAGLVVIAGGLTGLLLTRHSTPAMHPVAAGVAALPAPTGPIVAPPQSAAPKPVAAPVSLTIPLIGVKTNLMTLGLAPDGELEVPLLSMASVAGWYTGSPRPGSIGSAIIVGHIDTTRGPAVFARLNTLTRGDKIYVKRADGTLVEFRVTSVQSYLKDDFPTEDVYGPVPDAELRLITCGGAWDAGHPPLREQHRRLCHRGELTRHPGRMTPEQRYEDLVDEFIGEDGVLPPPGGSGFGRGALRYRKKDLRDATSAVSLWSSCLASASMSWWPRVTVSGSTPTRAPR